MSVIERYSQEAARGAVNRAMGNAPVITYEPPSTTPPVTTGNGKTINFGTLPSPFSSRDDASETNGRMPNGFRIGGKKISRRTLGMVAASLLAGTVIGPGVVHTVEEMNQRQIETTQAVTPYGQELTVSYVSNGSESLEAIAREITPNFPWNNPDLPGLGTLVDSLNEIINDTFPSTAENFGYKFLSPKYIELLAIAYAEPVEYPQFNDTFEIFRNPPLSDPKVTLKKQLSAAKIFASLLELDSIQKAPNPNSSNYEITKFPEAIPDPTILTFGAGGRISVKTGLLAGAELPIPSYTDTSR